MLAVGWSGIDDADLDALVRRSFFNVVGGIYCSMGILEDLLVDDVRMNAAWPSDLH